MNTTKLCPKCGKPLAPDALLGLCPECMMQAGLETETQPAGAPKPPAPVLDVADVAKHFPQLEILERLGQGGMGVVFQARQPQLDRLVALKIMLPEYAQHPAFAERFTREARALAKLNHPNIVAVYEFGHVAPPPGDEARAATRALTPALSHPMGEGAATTLGTSGLFYFIMEYVDGANLRQMLRSGHLSPEQAFAIVPKICDALQFAHDEGIMHRDIKPENILIDKKGRVKIADFGLAKILGREQTDLTLTGVTMGTPKYMAPEQIENAKAVDHRADIYSLGVVFYEMLTGELPLGRFAPPSQKVQVDVRLDEVVLHTLEKEPARRYQHASEVKTAVESIASPVSPGTPKIALAGLPAPDAPLEDARAQVEAAVHRVAWPATGLLATGIVNGIIVLFLIAFGFWLTRRAPDPRAWLALAAVGTWVILLTSLITIGAWKMKRLENYGWAMAASIIAIVGGTIGLPFGIWSLVVLAQPEVKAAFRRQRDPALQGAVGLPSAQPGSWLGHLSLWTAIAGVVLPILLVIGIGLLARLLRWSDLSDGFILLCWALGAVLELVALGCGIVARRTATGKAGLIISSISLVLYIAVYLAVFTIREGRSGSVSSGLVQSFSLVETATGRAVITEAPAEGGSMKDTLYRAFRYQVTGPVNHRAAFWLECWRAGTLDPLSPLTRGQMYAPPRDKAFNGFLEFSLTEGRKLSPSDAGKLRWDLNVEQRVDNLTTRGTNFVSRLHQMKTRSSSGDWAADPFAGLNASSTWGTVRRWTLAPGQPATLLTLRGDKDGQLILDNHAEDLAKQSQVCLFLRARFDPIPESQRVDWPSSVSMIGPGLEDFLRRAPAPAASPAAAPGPGQPASLRSFGPADPTIATNLTVEGGGWFATCAADQTIPLFEVPNPGVENCLVLYRAKLKTEALRGRAYLEMWCRLPGRGEFFSKGLDKAVTGTADWAAYEIPFLLNPGDQPDRIRLNLAVEGAGKIWIKDLELLKAPRP